MKDSTTGRPRGGRWRGIVATLAASALALAMGPAAMAASVTPTVIGGANNDGKSCAEAFPGSMGLEEVPGTTGTYSDGKLSVDVVAPSAHGPSTNSVDWTATGGYVVVGVVVKDGNDGANKYDYGRAGSLGDTYLTTPNDGAKGISHINFCYMEPEKTLFPLTATKTAAGTYDRTVRWTLEKSVDDPSHTAFAGEVAGSSTWTVVATKSEQLGNYRVAGEIVISNMNNYAVPFSVTDTLSDGTPAVVDCQPSTPGDQSTGTVAAGAVGDPSTATCSYVATPSGMAATSNTAVISTDPGAIAPEDATATVAWQEHLIGYDSGTLADPRFDYSRVISSSTTKTFDETFTCPTSDEATYVNGKYEVTEINQATLARPIGLQASANVTVTCYLPSATKTAKATYDETHAWRIRKGVNPTAQSGYPGDVLDWEWVVRVAETSSDGNFAVMGTITVNNPNPDVALDATVTDVLNDATVATVDCDPDPQVVSNEVVVPKGGSAQCTYTAAPTGRTATVNTATITTDHGVFEATARVVWEKTVKGGQALVTDDQIGLEEILTAGEGPWDFSKSDSHTCSSLARPYWEDGEYSATLDNTATVTARTGSMSASASTTYTCQAGFMDLMKLTEGMVDPTAEWQFALYEGPDGFGSAPIGTGTVFGDADGILHFGHPALRPDTTYTVCELGLPVGYTSDWMVNGAPVTAYNPDHPTEDVGNRCVDFGDATAVPVEVGKTVHFVVDNVMRPSPRTPGYWKNWNACTNGNQVAVAERNGGSAEGFWLVEDVLPMAWDDPFTYPDAAFMITTCEQAVEIMSMRVVTLNGVVNDGKVLASDPARKLARNLLAAEANMAAGVYVPFEVSQAMADAEKLLDKVNFTGTRTTAYLKVNVPDGILALRLAGLLDQFNNGMYVGFLTP